MVTATTALGNVTRTAKTSLQGRYTIAIPASTDSLYRMSFAAMGFATKSADVKRGGDLLELVVDAMLDRVSSISVGSAMVSRATRPTLTASDSAMRMAWLRLRQNYMTAADSTPVPRPADGFFDFQVTQQVRQAPGNTPPDYPAMLQAANVEGEVTAQFVVNTDGTPDPATFRAVKSTNFLFTDAVKQSLPAMKFIPAMVGTQPVKQLTQMPFVFTLSK